MRVSRMPLAFRLTLAWAIRQADTIWASPPATALSYRPDVSCLRVPFSQVCCTRCWCVHALYYLGFVSHGSFAQHRDLGSSLFLQTFDCIALRSQNLSHEIELMAKKKKKQSRAELASRWGEVRWILTPRERCHNRSPGASFHVLQPSVAA